MSASSASGGSGAARLWRRPPRRAPRGFSLIEVIVALVLIAGFGAALFTWAGQTLQTVTRAVQAVQRAELERNVTELAASLNPGLRPSGQWQTATHLYRWTSQAVLGPSDQVRTFAGVAPFQVALYRVHFTVTDLAEPGSVLSAERQVAGWRQVRPRNDMPFGIGSSGAKP
ncbi:MAG: type II secretion system protein [Gammaproteobacteria bacterium]|nr:type II secretion system protein [Gammaproteobacteria bacterium]